MTRASTPRPIFILGVARSGTNLVARMLDLHPQIEVVLDALLPVFRELRDLSVPSAAGRPMADYYGPGGPLQLAAALEADLDRPLPPGRTEQLRTAIAARASLEAADLSALAPALKNTPSLRSAIDAVLHTVVQVRGGPATRWVGAKEVWTVEFVPALARAFPEALFILVERDPRAVLASLLTLGDRDPTQQAHTVSYLRHWRKHIAMAWLLAQRPDLATRLVRIAYEDLVEQPALTAAQLADFLQIDSPERMLALANAPDRRHGGLWVGNSSYGPLEGLDPRPLDLWRQRLDADTRAAVQCVCGPEARLSVRGLPGGPLQSPDGAVERHFRWAEGHAGSWRSDGGSWTAALDLERRRFALLAGEVAATAELEECFLAPQIFAAVAAAA